jgi:large repetitive protein
LGVRRLSLALGAVLAAALIAPAAAFALDATSTTVSCTPPSILVGGITSCSATVLDDDQNNTPTGTLEFTSDTAGGAFQEHGPGDPATSCTLTSVGENGGSCRLDYVPGAVGSGVHKITATYSGDVGHDAGAGSANVGVTGHSTMTSLSCSPGSLTLGAGTSTCVITVTDTNATASTPTGSVALSSPLGGFDGGCGGLTPLSASQASCTTVYTPSLAGPGSLSGAYGGDSTHATSAGTAQVSATAVPAVNKKKKCKKKKRKRSAAAAKKCKKKKR